MKKPTTATEIRSRQWDYQYSDVVHKFGGYKILVSDEPNRETITKKTMFKNIFCKWNKDKIKEIAKWEAEKAIEVDKFNKIHYELRDADNLTFDEDNLGVSFARVTRLKTDINDTPALKFSEFEKNFDLEDLAILIRNSAENGYTQGYKDAQAKFEKKKVVRKKKATKKK